MKVLSPETYIIALGQGLFSPEASIDMCVIGECIFDVPGSESVAGKRTVHIGTWENRSVPAKSCQGTEEVPPRQTTSEYPKNQYVKMFTYCLAVVETLCYYAFFDVFSSPETVDWIRFTHEYDITRLVHCCSILGFTEFAIAIPEAPESECSQLSLCQPVCLSHCMGARA